MFMTFDNLWLFRGDSEGNRCIDEFIKDGIIEIGWIKLGDMKHKRESLINSELTQAGYSTSNVTIGVINHFINNMHKGDLCLIPDDNKIYIAKIDSDYFYDETKKIVGFPHTRKVTFLNADQPIDMYDLPENLQKYLQKSLDARNTVANLIHHKQLFINFMNNVDDVDKVDNTSENDISATINIKKELLSMLPKALQNIKNDLEGDDATRRGTASIEIIRLIKSFQE